MLWASSVLIVALCSILILRKKYFNHHWLALSLVLIAMIFVAWGGISNKDENVTTVLGCSLVIIGNFLFSLNVIIQELLFRKYKTNAMKFSGLEGIFGTFYLGVAVTILAFIPCEGENAWLECFNGIFVNSKTSFHVLFHTKSILFLYIGFALTGSFMKIASVYLVKSTSATARMTIDASWIVLVWVFFLLWSKDSNVHETFNPIQFVGFIFLVSGTLLFNEIVVLPILGLDKNTKDKI